LGLAVVERRQPMCAPQERKQIGPIVGIEDSGIEFVMQLAAATVRELGEQGLINSK